MPSSAAMPRTILATKRRPNRAVSSDNIPEPLSKSQIRELKRRIRDSDDRTRYLLVSAFTRRFVLYYNVSDDTFAMNNPSLGTLFKRKAAAIAIQHLMRTSIEVVRCRVDRRDRLIVSSIPRLRPHWARRFARRAVVAKQLH